MRYVIAEKWGLTEHFVIEDGGGAPLIEVRGNLGLGHHLTLRDQSHTELAEIKKHLATTRHEILVGGRKAAEVHHAGVFGDKYDIDSSFGRLTARGHFAGRDYTIHQGHHEVAKVWKKLSLREKFGVDIADGTEDVFILAVVLAIDEIHHELEREEHHRI